MDLQEQIKIAKRRTLAWASDLLISDGFKGSKDASLSLYKAPVVFLAAAQGAYAGCAMNAALQLGFEDGDFHSTYRELRSRSYRNSWLAWGAHSLGMYDVSEPVIDRLEHSLHPQMHGAPDDDTLPQDRQYFTAGSTAQVANVLIMAGRFKVALRAGGFLRELVLQQANAFEFVTLARNYDSSLFDLRSQSHNEGLEALSFQIHQHNPVCWVVGLMLRVFARLYRYSGDTSWLQAADTVHRWLLLADDSKYTNITSAKLAWGTAEMACVTGDAKWYLMARKILDWLVSQQEISGVWVRRPQYENESAQPIDISLDTSLERLLYLIDIPRALSLTHSHPSFQGQAS